MIDEDGREGGEQLDPELANWIEATIGGTITTARRVDRWRANWTVDAKTTGTTVPLFVKVPRLSPTVAARSVMLSTYGTHREAAALRILPDTGVDVPRLVGFHAPSGSVLMERVQGAGYLLSESNETRRTLMGQYARQLAALHRVADVDAAANELNAPGHARGRPGPLAAVLRDYDAVKAKFGVCDPLVDIALHWLREHTPGDETVRLLHGDAGPNQFMFQGDELTVLVDWEIAHLGDPMSDIGYTRFRECLYPTGAFDHFVSAYQAAADHPIDPEKVDYFTISAALLLLLGVARDVHRPRAHNPEAIQRFWWDALARVAICEVLGGEIEPPRGPSGRGGESEVSTLAGLLTQRLRHRAGNCGVHHVDAALSEALSLALDHRLDVAAAIDATELLGTAHSADASATRRRLEEMARGSEHAVATAVRYLGRRAAARLEALSPIAATDSWDNDPDRRESMRRALPLVPSMPPT